MQKLGINGVIRDEGYIIAIPDDAATWSADMVQRKFIATRPNRLWVADITHVATWQGLIYVAFVIGLCPSDRRLAGLELA